MAFGLGSFLLKSFLGGLAGAVGSGSGSQQQPGTEGIQSGLGNVTPPPVQENPVGGLLRSVLGKVAGDVGTGISGGVTSALMKPFGLMAGQRQGEMNRASLDAAFPELNAWEKAGVSATGPGIQAAAVENQNKLQEKEFKQQTALQENQLALERLRLQVQERMNAVSAAAGVQSAGISAGPSWAMVPTNVELGEANTRRADADTAYTYDNNTRGWVSNLATAMMADRSYGYSMSPGQSSKFQTDSVRSVLARDLFGSVGSAAKYLSGFFGKAGKSAKAKGTAYAPRVAPKGDERLVDLP